ADRQRHRDQADPEIAAQHQDVNADIGADHEECAMGKIDHGQHAENQGKTDRKQHINRAEREPGEQLQCNEVEAQTGHVKPSMRIAKERERAELAHPRFRHQALWPSSSQLRRLASLGSSVEMISNTSASFFMSFDFDLMTSTDCTDWWSHWR